MRHLGTVKLLVEWARWGSAHHIDYPTLSPMFGERALKSPLFGVGHIPPDVYRVEQAVCRLYWTSRQVLILRYQHRMTTPQIGERINRCRQTALQWLMAAENEVHHQLQKNVGNDLPESVRSGARLASVSREAAPVKGSGLFAFRATSNPKDAHGR